MKIQKENFYSLLVVLVFSVTSVAPQIARAHEGHDHSADHSQARQEAAASPTEIDSENQEGQSVAREAREKSRQRREELQAKAQQKKAEAKDSSRIDRCEKKRARLQEKYGALQDRAQKVEERIQARLARAQAFAAKKNLTVPNDEVLLADIEAKRLAVVAGTENIKSAAAGFDCANDDAKAQAALIRTEVQAFKAAVKEYRTAVKAYFAAVIQAYTATLPSSTESPSTSTTTTVVPNQGENS